MSSVFMPEIDLSEENELLRPSKSLRRPATLLAVVIGSTVVTLLAASLARGDSGPGNFLGYGLAAVFGLALGWKI